MKEHFEKKFWEYFLNLENDFNIITDTIPVDSVNYQTHSIKYMNLLFSICSEIDVLFKKYIEFNEWFDFTSINGNMKIYREVTTEKLQSFSNETVVFSKVIELQPFKSWQVQQSPNWWKDYNELKHDRLASANNSKATQENILNAFAALYQLEMYFFKSILEKDSFEGRLKMPVPHSKNYRIKNWSDNVDLIDNRYIFYINENGNLILEGE